MQLFFLIVLLASACQVQAKAVFAHFMVCFCCSSQLQAMGLMSFS